MAKKATAIRTVSRFVNEITTGMEVEIMVGRGKAREAVWVQPTYTTLSGLGANSNGVYRNTVRFEFPDEVRKSSLTFNADAEGVWPKLKTRKAA